MVKYIIARQLTGRKVVTTDGFDLGRFVDAEISPVTGKIDFLLVEPNMDSTMANRIKDDKGGIKVPYSAVTAVNDYIMIDRRNVQ